MRDVSAEFLDAIAGSARMATRARVCAPGQTGTDPVGEMIPVVEGGNVRLDGTADVRSTVDMTTLGHDWDPQPGMHPVQPYGNEVFVERGVEIAPGNFQYVSLGYHKLYSVNQVNAPDGELRIAAKDRNAALIDAKMIAPVQYPAHGSIGAVFAQLVGEVYPAAVIEFDDDLGTEQLGRAQIVDKDRYAFLRDLAMSHGKILYWDHRGVLVIRDVPSAESPVWDVGAGKGGLLVEASRSIDREGVFNGVVAEGQAPDSNAPAVRAVTWDASPTSPTFWDGPFGKVPTFYTSSNITTYQQASSAGRALLERSLGLPYYADFSAVPNEALEPYDPIRLKYADTTGREVHILDTVVIPLSAKSAMTGTTRERTTVQIATTGGTGEV